MDLETIDELVCGALWIILAPVSWCCPALAKAIESMVPRAPSPSR
jgi:hypothetical protein